MRRFRKAAIWLAAISLAGAAQAKPAVWTVRGAKGTIVLFGSVHMLPDGLDWRPAALMQALSQATDLWFELPISQATDEVALRMALREGRLPAGETLWRRLDPEAQRRVQLAASATGTPRDALSGLRPWLADLTLSLAAASKAGARPGGGVDFAIQNEAPPTARRHAFETVRQQMNFLEGGSQAEQIASLTHTANDIVKDPDLYARTVREWLDGDVAALQRDDLDTMSATTPQAYRRLITDRNHRWARILAAQARKGGLTVVVVGAGHLIGPEGVPGLLRRRGLVVDGP